MRFLSVATLMFALVLSACGRDGPTELPPGVIVLNVGQGRTLTASQAATIEISGGSGAEFVLIPFHASQTPTSTVALEFSGTQITGVIGPPSPQVGPAVGPQLLRAPSADALSAAARFHTSLRRLERGELARRLAAIRAARASRTSPLYSSAAAMPVPAVGDQMTLNVNRAACTNAINHTGRVVALTTRAVIVADNDNPLGGFTDAEYLEIAQEFDNLVYPTITQNFGTPRDIDVNEGRSVVFYTRAVNELTPAGANFVIGGFFHPRDLFPKVGPDPNSTTDDCAGSNEAEMFYMLVPDPNGQVNGNARTKDYVRRTTVGVLAHEFQHLINASYRIGANAPEFEDVWLNEGLSHIAEELMFYRVSGLAPRGNITLAKLRESQTYLDAVNAYQVSNLGRLIEYLEDPEARSPYAEDDELATRGATWQLLRYAADRSSTAEQTLWRRLGNSTSSGIPNFTAAFGDFFSHVRNWATAQYTDDAVAQAPAEYRHLSWHYRSLLPTLINNTNPPPYPLKTRSLVNGTPLSLTLRGGSAAYLRFGVGSGATGRINAMSSGGGALPAAVSLTVVRTR
jgi:predicted small lipoprotein YifL